MMGCNTWGVTHEVCERYISICPLLYRMCVGEGTHSAGVLQCVAVCCSVLRWVAVCCDELQCVAVCYVTCVWVRAHILQVGRSTLQCVAVCCSMLQCVAVCCRMLQCVISDVRDWGYMYANASRNTFESGVSCVGVCRDAWCSWRVMWVCVCACVWVCV